MKKNKGFTLIELAATILVMGVIALIAVKIIGGMIRSAKEKAFLNSTYGYIKAANTYYEDSYAENTFKQVTIRYGNKKASSDILKVESQSYVPDVGKLKISRGAKVAVAFYDKGLSMCAYKNNSTEKVSLVHVDISSECTYNGKEKVPEGEDITGLCHNTLSYEDTTNFQIQNIEGLVCLSQQVDQGKTFEGKIIKQATDLDIKSQGLYDDYTTDFYGDINNNGEEEELYTELTTEKGFDPIGQADSKKFFGTYEGYGYNIENIYINRPDEDYVGIFAYSKGTIRGINIYDVNITGHDYVGGVAGKINSSTINEIKITGNITGNINIGGVTGYNDYGNIISILAKPSITSVATSTSQINVGGIAGFSYYATAHGILFGGSIDYVSGKSNVNYLSGGNYGKNADGLYNNITSNNNIGVQGYHYSYDSINTYEEYLDTWIGGDNDSSGYYFDYDDDNEILVKSTFKDPITFNLAGSGTEEDPYLISSYQDYKEATTKVKGLNEFLITNDIDFSGKNYYEFGSYINQFDGHLNGDMHILTNMNIQGRNNVGLSGYINTGIIEGLNIKNSSISGNDYVGTINGFSVSSDIKGINIYNVNIVGNDNTGGVVGRANSCNIKEIKITGNITGNSNTGGIVGYSDHTKNLSLLINMNIESIFNVGSAANLGGVSGYSYYSTIYGILNGGSIKVTPNKSCANYLSGGNYSSGVEGLYIDSFSISGPINAQGNRYLYDTINTYEEYLDTWIGGDNDSSGYYFDYDDDNEILVKSTFKDPITFNLAGSGTEEDPYLISSYQDYKEATTKVKGLNEFLITNDIDFSGKNYYEFGSYINQFDGHLNGDMHILTNMNIQGRNNVGLSGYINTGIIEGLNIKNSSISGNDYVGTINGFSVSSDIKGINIYNVNIVGNDNTGGVVGRANSCNIKEIKITGNITGNSNTGGIVGYSDHTKNLSLLINMNIESIFNVGSAANLGGVSGYSYYSTIYGILNGGSIKVTPNKSCANYLSGGNHSSGVYGLYVENFGTSGSVGEQGTDFDVEYANSLEYLSGPLKTDKTEYIESPYTGDKNETGYFFDYNDAENDIVVVKVYNPSNQGTAAPKDPVPSGGVGTTSGYGSMASSFSYVPNPSASDAVVPT
ncbi:MAG TPA: type II secretion system protein, partial [Bacilli bacterium]|nr:type II secretion system protein [Bacilli bacterium]